MYQHIYFTLTITADSLSDARRQFGSIEGTLRTHFVRLGINNTAGSRLLPIGIDTRMQLLYNFSHMGAETHYKFNFIKERNAKHDWVNIVSPNNMIFYNDYFVLNKSKYGRVFYCLDYPGSLDSVILTELSQTDCVSYVTVNSELLDLSALKGEITRKHSRVGLKIESEKTRNRRNNDFLSDANPRLLNEMDRIELLSRDIETGDDHFFNTSILVMIICDSMDELKKNTEALISKVGVLSMDIKPAFNMQRQGLNSAYMFGIQEFKRVCNYSAPCLAMFMPFKTQEINEKGGIYYGVNQISQNPIFKDRKNLYSRHGLILGGSGGGKSVFSKWEIGSVYATNPDDCFIIIDPQGEYKKIVNDLDGSIISFDPKQDVYINPLDVDFDGVDYSTLQEVIDEKTDFIITLLSSCMRRDLEPDEAGILDEVVDRVYSDNYSLRKRLNGEGAEVTEFSVPNYMKVDKEMFDFDMDLDNEQQIRSYSPTLQDVYQKLLDSDKALAHKLAGHMQIFVNGSLNLFNHRTNVDLNNRLLCFDISVMKENLRSTCMLVMLEIMHRKTMENWKNGKWTRVQIDEFHELLRIESVANRVVQYFKEFRKFHGILTGITQNMADLLKNTANSDNLKSILSLSDFFVLLRQSSIDRGLLEDFFPWISPALFTFVEGARPATGLLVVDTTSIPFDIEISEDSYVYGLVNTD